MSEILHRLVYYSRNRIEGSPEEVEAVIARILAVSRRNNERAGVSGALMFNAGCFAQVLEGPAAAVEATFERIQQDPNHGDVLLLAFEPVLARAFANWSMAFVGNSEAGAARFGALGSSSGFDMSRMSGNALFATLHGLTLEEEPTPEEELVLARG
nr:BLUF domain-containing protein [uncultured Lichenicoccus sp.]